jgi:ABC-2 type transport system permease protein
MFEPARAPAGVGPRVRALYNPGLESSWFVVTGTIGILLVLNGSIVAAAALVAEKEAGTVEQLLMTPASAAEVIAAKVGPLFALLTLDILLAAGVSRLAFGLPCRGPFQLFFAAGCLCVLAGIGIGMLLAVFSATQQQAQLVSFFVNAPVALVSGATTPLEAMPGWLERASALNPVRHFAAVARAVMLKGAGPDAVAGELAALAAIAAALLAVSVWRFRRQLG